MSETTDEKARRRQLAAKLSRESPLNFDECLRKVNDAEGDEALARAMIQTRATFGVDV